MSIEYNCSIEPRRLGFEFKRGTYYAFRSPDDRVVQAGSHTTPDAAILINGYMDPYFWVERQNKIKEVCLCLLALGYSKIFRAVGEENVEVDLSAIGIKDADLMAWIEESMLNNGYNN